MNPDVLADLEEQRAFLLRSLDDLDRELAAGDLDALDAATLRTDYTERLTEVQRSIEAGEVVLAEGAGPRRRGRTAAVVAVVVALALGAGVLVANTAGSRRPGESATGDIRQFSVDKLTEAARLQDEGKYLDALKTYDAVLADDPRNPEALAERGFLLLKLAAGRDQPELVRDGLDYVRQARALDPTNERWKLYETMGKALADRQQ